LFISGFETEGDTFFACAFNNDVVGVLCGFDAQCAQRRKFGFGTNEEQAVFICTQLALQMCCTGLQYVSWVNNVVAREDDSCVLLITTPCINPNVSTCPKTSPAKHTINPNNPITFCIDLVCYAKVILMWHQFFEAGKTWRR